MNSFVRVLFPLASAAIALGCGSEPTAQPQEPQPHHRRIIPPDIERSDHSPEPSADSGKAEAEPEPEPDEPDEPDEPEYALDRMSRKVPISGDAFCPPIELVTYSGAVLPFHKPLRINEAFQSHLREFEQIARDAAIEVYGRPPTSIRQFGSYYCRRISTWPYLVSEHGLGNAVDVGGFDFSRLKSGEFPDAPRRWRKSFAVRISRHWNASGREAEHSRFLELLARRVIEREGLFRVILGPAHPGHHDHFHLDMARWRIVNVF